MNPKLNEYYDGKDYYELSGEAQVPKEIDIWLDREGLICIFFL